MVHEFDSCRQRLCDAVYTWRGHSVDDTDSVLNCDWLSNITNNALHKQ